MKQLNILFRLPKAIPQTVHPDQKLTASTGCSWATTAVVPDSAKGSRIRPTGLVQAGKQPVNQRSREFGSADLSIKEKTLPIAGPVRIECGPWRDVFAA